MSSEINNKNINSKPHDLKIQNVIATADLKQGLRLRDLTNLIGVDMT